MGGEFNKVLSRETNIKDDSFLRYYDEACIMHLTVVVHNYPKAADPLCTNKYQIPIPKEKGATIGILVSRFNNRR